ncbi:MAG: Na+/H+ antiporter subunit C [Rhodospirillaceae bacterium]
MDLVLPILTGVLIACSTYLMLSRNLVRVVLGLSLLSNAVNLIIFASGRVTRAIPPLIAEGGTLPPDGYANPLPQALVLTAIVIGFGLLAFALVLTYRSYQELGTVDTTAMRHAEPDTESPYDDLAEARAMRHAAERGTV